MDLLPTRASANAPERTPTKAWRMYGAMVKAAMLPMSTPKVCFFFLVFIYLFI